MGKEETMPKIYNTAGAIRQIPSDLRGLRKFISDFPENLQMLFLTSLPDGRGRLTITWKDNSFAIADFNSFNVLCTTITNWRSLYGLHMFINGAYLGYSGKLPIMIQEASDGNDNKPRNKETTKSNRQKVIVMRT